MKLIYSLLLIVALCLSCTKVDLKRDVPECIEEKIREFAKTDSTCESGAEVSEYEFQEAIVYTFYGGSCGADRGTVVCDDQCNSIGGLGGFGNTMEVNGEDFASNAVFIGLVWSN